MSLSMHSSSLLHWRNIYNAPTVCQALCWLWGEVGESEVGDGVHPGKQEGIPALMELVIQWKRPKHVIPVQAKKKYGQSVCKVLREHRTSSQPTATQASEGGMVIEGFTKEIVIFFSHQDGLLKGSD